MNSFDSLSQAISNLLNNAVKFVAPGTKPKVDIWTERRNADIRLWIADNSGSRFWIQLTAAEKT